MKVDHILVVFGGKFPQKPLNFHFLHLFLHGDTVVSSKELFTAKEYIIYKKSIPS